MSRKRIVRIFSTTLSNRVRIAQPATASCWRPSTATSMATRSRKLKLITAPIANYCLARICSQRSFGACLIRALAEARSVRRDLRDHQEQMVPTDKTENQDRKARPAQQDLWARRVQRVRLVHKAFRGPRDRRAPRARGSIRI